MTFICRTNSIKTQLCAHISVHSDSKKLTLRVRLFLTAKEGFTAVKTILKLFIQHIKKLKLQKVLVLLSCSSSCSVTSKPLFPPLVNREEIVQTIKHNIKTHNIKTIEKIRPRPLQMNKTARFNTMMKSLAMIINNQNKNASKTTLNGSDIMERACVRRNILMCIKSVTSRAINLVAKHIILHMDETHTNVPIIRYGCGLISTISGMYALMNELALAERFPAVMFCVNCLDIAFKYQEEIDPNWLGAQNPPTFQYMAKIAHNLYCLKKNLVHVSKLPKSQQKKAFWTQGMYHHDVEEAIVTLPDLLVLRFFVTLISGFESMENSKDLLNHPLQVDPLKLKSIENIKSLNLKSVDDVLSFKPRTRDDVVDIERLFPNEIRFNLKTQAFESISTSGQQLLDYARVLRDYSQEEILTKGFFRRNPSTRYFKWASEFEKTSTFLEKKLALN